VTRAIVEKLLKRNEEGKKSAIINLSSICALTDNTGVCVYGAAKAYNLSLGRAMNALYSSKGIDVLTVHPGPVNTQMYRGTGPGRIQSPEFASSVINQLGWQTETYGNWWHAYYMCVVPYILPQKWYYDRLVAISRANYLKMRAEREAKAAAEKEKETQAPTEAKN